jgi:hypothetical protein
MLSSNLLLSFLATASFALTSATAVALKPRATNSHSKKVCSNDFYSSPQCCIPNEDPLDTPDCITREFTPNPPSLVQHLFPQPFPFDVAFANQVSVH